MRLLIHTILCAAYLSLLQGCAMLRTDKSQYAGMEQMLAQRQYPAAIAQIEAAKETAYTYKDRVVYYLDLGMLHHWNGDYETSNELLEKAAWKLGELNSFSRFIPDTDMFIFCRIGCSGSP